MDVNFKLVIMIGASFVLLALLLDTWLRAHRLQLDPTVAKNEKDERISKDEDIRKDEKNIAEEMSSEDMNKDNFIAIYVIAKKDGCFASYDLLQAILSTGMQYGAMNIFHFIEDTPKGRLVVFSLASATEPGEFDLNNIGELTCAGLILFMNIAAVSDPGDAFLLMLETAEQLADSLGGDVCAAPTIPWTQDVFHHYENKIMNQLRLL